MVHINVPTCRCLAVALLAVFAVSCNNTAKDASPKLKTIPLQKVSGGTSFVLDLKSYVSNSAAPTYSVVTGGGSFSGSVYTRAFPTLGTYTVEFQVVNDGGGKISGSFQVQVTSAEIALVRNNTGLNLLDTQTSNFASVFQDDGRTKTYKASLTDGSVIFEVTQNSQKDLWLHNPNQSNTDVFGGDTSKDDVYVGKTSKGLILFMTGSAPTRGLKLYNPLNKTSFQVFAAADGSRDERNAMIDTTNDIIYFESAKNGGQADIYAWNVASSTATAVSTNAKDEDLMAIMPNGAAIFRRTGAAAEWDLFYYTTTTGVLEVGADMGVGPAAESKAYKAGTSTGIVVFETTDTGNDEDLYAWSATTNTTTTIAMTANDETWVATSGSGRMIYTTNNGGGDFDLSWWNPATLTGGNIATSGNNETYNATLKNGDIVYTVDTGAGGKDLTWWDESGNTSTTFPGAGATNTDQVFRKLLKNDDVVYTTGADIYVYTTTTNTAVSITTAAGTESFGGESTGGDFVISLVTGGNTHLYLWDKSATTAVAISTAAGTATFQGASSGNLILYSRINTGATTSNLYSFAPATTTTKQVTDNAVNDTVDAVISATVN